MFIIKILMPVEACVPPFFLLLHYLVVSFFSTCHRCHKVKPGSKQVTPRGNKQELLPITEED